MSKLTGVVLTVSISLLVVVSNWQSASAASSPVLIIAIQTGGSANASEEYIEIANTTDTPQSLSGMYIEYYSAASTSFGKPTRRIALSGSINPRETYVLATAEYSGLPVDQIYSPTLAASGGHLRLVGAGSQLGMVSWGSAAMGTPALAPAAGTPMRRQSKNGEYIDTDNSSNDFSDAVYSGLSSIELELSEVLPDPVAPVLDSTGEYIEIHVIGTQIGTFAGWKIRVGLKSFILPDQSVSPGNYVVFYAPQTKLSLRNNGATIQLQNPKGDVVDELVYPKALTGSAWARDGLGWQWTTVPSPGAANQIINKNAATTHEPKAAVKKSVKTTKTVKPKAKSKKSTSKTQKGKVDAAATSTPAVAKEQAVPAVHNAVIAGVGGLAVLYGAYEYRYDVINLYRKLRGDRKAR